MGLVELGVAEPGSSAIGGKNRKQTRNTHRWRSFNLKQNSGPTRDLTNSRTSHSGHFHPFLYDIDGFGSVIVSHVLRWLIIYLLRRQGCAISKFRAKASGLRVALSPTGIIRVLLVSGPELLYHIFVEEFLLFSSVRSTTQNFTSHFSRLGR